MLLADRDLSLNPATVARTARAQAAIESAAELMPDDHIALARLLLRAEGMASSFIEGVRAPVVDIVLAEAEPGSGPSPAAWVAGNLGAVTQALDEVGEPLSLKSLCGWHRTLMTGSPTPEHHVGRIRTEQGWIGGTSPLDANLVTPPVEYLPDLLADLLAYANRADIDPVAQAALAHAQFEVIHPFADGNGRIGRVLVGWLLARRLSLVTPPPVSTHIAADVGGYGAGLALFRLGDHNNWIQWFADAVSGAGRAQRELVEAAQVLRVEFEHRLDDPVAPSRRVRTDAAARRILGLMPGHLVLTGPLVADALGIPLKSAGAGLRTLVEFGILVEHGTLPSSGPGRPSRLYTSPELLGLTGSTPLRS